MYNIGQGSSWWKPFFNLLLSAFLLISQWYIYKYNFWNCSTSSWWVLSASMLSNLDSIPKCKQRMKEDGEETIWMNNVCNPASFCEWFDIRLKLSLLWLANQQTAFFDLPLEQSHTNYCSLLLHDSGIRKEIIYSSPILCLRGKSGVRRSGKSRINPSMSMTKTVNFLSWKWCTNLRTFENEFGRKTFCFY